MKRVYVVTHTESLHHIQGLGGGWFDTSLTATGKEHARNIAKRLYEELKAADIPIYCSDLKRTSEVAFILEEVFHSPVIKDRRLREMCYGDAEGKDKSWQSANIIFPTDSNRMDHRVYKNSESRREMASRIIDFLNDLEHNMFENSIIVTHGFALTFVILGWLKIPIENMGYANFRGNPGGVTLLVENDTFRNREVAFLNNTVFMK